MITYKTSNPSRLLNNLTANFKIMQHLSHFFTKIYFTKLDPEASFGAKNGKKKSKNELFVSTGQLKPLKP